jgi:hypothetical protein
MNTVITPEKFWKAYKAEMLKNANAEARYAYCHSDMEWTPYAMNAAIKAIEGIPGLKNQREYFRLDAIGYESHGMHDWTLRIAFEHENRDHWTDELCKLCHVVADLRVLATYWDFKGGKKVETCIEGYLKNLQSRIKKNPGQWLFILGPRCKSFGRDYPYVAYASDGITLDKLEDDGSLNPYKWPNNGVAGH